MIPILSVQCGISQWAQVDAVLNKNIPHPTIDLISMELKRTNPTAYDTALNDHMNFRDMSQQPSSQMCPMAYLSGYSATFCHSVVRTGDL